MTRISNALAVTLLLLASLLLRVSHAQAEQTPLPEDILRLRDPFKRPVLRIEGSEIRTPLQSYSLSSMKMIGILTGPLRLRAMILTPDGNTHFVSENAPIGQRNGVVRKITEDRIHVRERIANILGQTENVDTEIRLSSGKAGGSAQEVPKGPAEGNSPPGN